jgi:hypothetical protein
MAALAVVPKPAVTLYDAEDALVSLAECVETVAPEQEAEFLAEFGRALATAVEKRDRVGQFLSHLEAQAEFAKHEIERLRARKAAFEDAAERIKRYVVRVIEAQGADAKGKYPKLEGRTVTFSLRKSPATVEIRNEAEVPVDYKAISLTLPVPLFESVMDALDCDLAGRLLDRSRQEDITLDKRAIKAAIDSGTAVPGADYAPEKHSLVRK